MRRIHRDIQTFFFVGVLFSAPVSAAPRGKIRLLYPLPSTAKVTQHGLDRVIEEWNTRVDSVKVETLRKGEGFSSLKDLVASHLAGDLPDLAVIESSEIPAVEKLGIAKPLTLNARATAPGFFPFRKTAPILIANQEMLFRIHANPEKLPTKWRDFKVLIQKLAGSLTSGSGQEKSSEAIALPLQGQAGLWIFESLSQKPLWRRQPGGLEANRELSPLIDEIRTMIDQPGWMKGDETWDRAIQAFVERKSALLVTSLDVLPEIASRAAFRWIVGGLPTPYGLADLEGGSVLVTLKDTPDVRAFLNYIYAPGIVERWTVADCFLPTEKKRVDHSKANAACSHAPRALGQSIWGKRKRSTDVSVIRARHEWVQALKALFQDRERRLPTELVMAQLDSRLGTE